MQDRFEYQRCAVESEPYPSLRARQDRLARLRCLLLDGRAELAAAIAADFGHRSVLETELIDVWPALSMIDYLRRHLPAWMKPEKRRVNSWFMPARACVMYQPRGVVGVISPWNYPLYLSLGPVATALAAGNRVMLKPSEQTPQFSAVLARMAAEIFSPDELHVVVGDVAVAQAFVALPFDYLLFTGATAAGRAVLQAAAQNLTPVTLELGGKSPTIIHPDYDLEHAVQRILHGKCLNAGQTCTAPDYVLIHESAAEKFVELARKTIPEFFPDLTQTPDYAGIINPRHYRRLLDSLDEAGKAGARIVPLHPQSGALEVHRKIAPTLVLDAPDATHLMQDEIFGPILPLVRYRTLDEAIAYVRARPKPLAAYYFDRDAQRVARVLREVPAGGMTINDTVLHTCQDDLPFGGVGASGMGAYHGREGFAAFSSGVGVFTQSRFNAMKFFLPPYGRLIRKFLKLTIK